MICKNESKHLKACLETVHDIVDEIIVLDSGSTDNTRQIAESYGAKWHVNTDWQGFGKQRQLAQAYATGDYVLVLDADERLDQPLRQAITDVLKILCKPIKYLVWHELIPFVALRYNHAGGIPISYHDFMHANIFNILI